MLKMYRSQAHSGSTREFWDDNWESIGGELAAAAAQCAKDPLVRLIESKLAPDRLFMDGGCGAGQWVKYFHDRGARSLGIDFAPRTVERIHRVAPELDVRLGDICRLPLADGEVHVYFSNGVVEHFESGPEPALAEARRVIAKDGWFLCSVPDASWLRERVLNARASDEKMTRSAGLGVRRVSLTRPEPAPAEMNFFQYAFKPEEFVPRLEAAGFEVVETFGNHLLWGLFEIPGVKPSYDALVGAARQVKQSVRRRNGNNIVSATDGGVAGYASPRRSGILGLLERALLLEDRSTPLLGPAVRIATEHAANMRMYVARPA